MSNRQLLDQLMALVAAGHETSASALAWAFEHLSRAPEVLAELSAEIDRDDGDAYLTATLQEVLLRATLRALRPRPPGRSSCREQAPPRPDRPPERRSPRLEPDAGVRPPFQLAPDKSSWWWGPASSIA